MFRPAVAPIADEFGLVVIDSAANRYERAVAAAGKPRWSGFVILDNSDWYSNTDAYLRGQDLIQVYLPDFRPLFNYRCTTSIFLHPGCRRILATGPLHPRAFGKDVAALNTWNLPAGAEQE